MKPNDLLPDYAARVPSSSTFVGMANRAISYLAALIMVTALPAAACQTRKGKETAGSGAAEAVNGNVVPLAPGAETQPELSTEAPFAAAIAQNLPLVPDPTIVFASSTGTASVIDNVIFRDRVVAFVRQVSAGSDQVMCDLPLPSQQSFRVGVWLYQQGAPVGHGVATDAKLCVALKDATRRAVAATGRNQSALSSGRFVIELPELDYALVEFQGKGVELVRGLVPTRVLDKALLARRIEEGKAYLLRVIDPKHKGVHKYYRATTDSFEKKIHTIYTASTIYTLLKLYAYDGDKRLLSVIEDAAGFLLSMQSRDRRERSFGGFFYAFDLEREQPEPRLVVGTTSKTIFSLIELHALTKDKKYMEAATLAADWLLSMLQPDGSVRAYLRMKQNGEWVFSKQESMLYTGQVLSALSRMYGATREPRYVEAATHIATYLASKVAQKGCYLGDDYRQPNPISSSWVVLSLFDFVKVTDDIRFKEIVFRCTDDLLARQIRNAKDVYRYGRWERSLSSSGNGWLAEVISEIYLYCRSTGMDGCERYQSSIIKSVRLLMQYTYSPENAFVVKNPEAAIGGVFWNVAERYVRTDSVCHAMNAYIHIIGELGDGTLIDVPEPPLAERLELAGKDAGSVPTTLPAINERVDDTDMDGPMELESSMPRESAEEVAR